MRTNPELESKERACGVETKSCEFITMCDDEMSLNKDL